MSQSARIIYHHEADGWWAESPDVEGWSAAGDSYAEVVKLAEEGIPLAKAAQVARLRLAAEALVAQELETAP